MLQPDVKHVRLISYHHHHHFPSLVRLKSTFLARIPSPKFLTVLYTSLADPLHSPNLLSSPNNYLLCASSPTSSPLCSESLEVCLSHSCTVFPNPFAFGLLPLTRRWLSVGLRPSRDIAAKCLVRLSLTTLLSCPFTLSTPRISGSELSRFAASY
ncbi:hypothetical protein BT63DRAFT_14657 [Microthyrium microscopicum]|uniref:Uncharacterized protein n=1 Tax=Microthyrium microscopicum TaxID=703497 RepID=A0A6A6US66_9PEZI|nr:hypothetical protein BT63DRAFT_14657 [Microthyrium microscopicum]